MTLRVDLEADVPCVGQVTITGTIEHEAAGQTQQQSVEAWLSNIDPEELKTAAIAGIGLGGPDPIASALLVLQGWARGGP